MPVDFLSHRLRIGISVCWQFSQVQSIYPLLLKQSPLILVPINVLFLIITFYFSFCKTIRSIKKHFAASSVGAYYIIKSIILFILAPLLRGLVNILILLSGNVHVNPGPRSNKFKFAAWNADSILTRDKCK